MVYSATHFDWRSDCLILKHTLCWRKYSARKQSLKYVYFLYRSYFFVIINHILVAQTPVSTVLKKSDKILFNKIQFTFSFFKYKFQCQLSKYLKYSFLKLKAYFRGGEIMRNYAILSNIFFSVKHLFTVVFCNVKSTLWNISQYLKWKINLDKNILSIY